ncbi:hypothetical protein NDU88_003138 [Pleurodeles waltl]|uniref:Uncharacterized protein n=1 Tax=Pleurodeles waltl TaxID=8319 RepID=A0AAV7WRY5_PLEWA|nr:hypothetical protein NDU88_003138 [Pleurodeles waltl]
MTLSDAVTKLGRAVGPVRFTPARDPDAGAVPKSPERFLSVSSISLNTILTARTKKESKYCAHANCSTSASILLVRIHLGCSSSSGRAPPTPVIGSECVLHLAEVLAAWVCAPAAPLAVRAPRMHCCCCYYDVRSAQLQRTCLYVKMLG